jgi:four helix bundle protein
MNRENPATVKIGRFEELIVWQKSREFASGIYVASARGPFARDFGLRDQLRRASVSVMATIAEGFERKGSRGEARSGLYLARDAGYLNLSDFERLMPLNEEIARRLGRMRRTVGAQRGLK